MSQRHEPLAVQGQRVTVVGLARSGVAAARWLVDQGASVTVTEAHDTPETRQAARQLQRYASVCGHLTVEIGKHTHRSLEGARWVVVSPGVPETAMILQWAEAMGLPIISEVELAWRGCPAPLVAVTGTNGKTTVTTLIGHMLRAGGWSVEVCGNIGRPFCEAIRHLYERTIVVLEISSFQLLRSPTLRPHVAAFLNLSSNHLDRHPNFAAYTEAKAKIFANQTSSDWAVLNAADPDVQSLASRVRSHIIWFNHDVPPAERITARNPNVEAAAAVAGIFGVSDDVIQQTVRNFRGLEHRLEHVATVRGVTCINDSKSTTPASLIWALERCANASVVLIAGGRNKGCDFAPVRQALARSTVKRIVLIGESRYALRQALQGIVPIEEATSLDDAVREAFQAAGRGETVLLSPACASFDMFANYEERGRRFKACVQALAHTDGVAAAPADEVVG